MWEKLLAMIFNSIFKTLLDKFTGPKIDEVIHADAVLENLYAKSEQDRNDDLIHRFDHVVS